MALTIFQKQILDWYQKDGRKDLPWQKNINPYRVWVSEIMLQQTQVSTVLPYYKRFMSSFPTIQKLAAAPQDIVMQHWSGLGYYSRARNLHRTAKYLTDNSDGIFPNEIDELMKLPGIGKTTAGAIKSLGFKQRGPILDGNVKRVLSRYHMIKGWYGNSKTNDQLWFYADKHTPFTFIREYTQAIMDIGATVCKKNNPKCCSCPIYSDCKARKNDKIRDYPEKKPRRKVPEKFCFFILIKNQKNEILLEKNYNQGVWQDLWVPPKCKIIEEMDDICSRLNLKVLSYNVLDQKKHVFSHFKLMYKTILVSVVEKKNQKHDKQKFWYCLNDELKIGVPAPIKLLLDNLREETYTKEANNVAINNVSSF